MHTVVETHAFRHQAEATGMTEEEINGLTVELATDPADGVGISGTGGCRNALATLTKSIVAEYRARIVKASA